VPRFSPELTRLLLIRGTARALAPIAVLWGIYDWCVIQPQYGVIYGILTFNYVLVYILSWIAPAMLNGPWRVRPWQTFVLLINFVALPIIFYKSQGVVPWFFVAVNLLFLIGLYVATFILFYLNNRLPMSNIFMARRGGMLPGTPPPIPSTPASP